MSHELYLLVLAIACLYVSVTDFIHRKIQNHALLLLLLLQSFLSPLDIQITTFLLVLGMGLILYALIWIGAGDIKYAAVLSLTILSMTYHGIYYDGVCRWFFSSCLFDY